MWDAPYSNNFKSTPLVIFDRDSNPYKYVTTFNTRMVIIGTRVSLECEVLSRTLEESHLAWYMNLSRLSITTYHDLSKKLIDQLSSSKHYKVSTISLFNIRWGILSNSASTWSVSTRCSWGSFKIGLRPFRKVHCPKACKLNGVDKRWEQNFT